MKNSVLFCSVSYIYIITNDVSPFRIYNVCTANNLNSYVMNELWSYVL